jgi:MazG family protein
MTPYVVEEAYEVLEAIEKKDPKALRDELGDLLFQIALLSRISADAGHFEFNDVVDAISDKLERRHPHVFQGQEPDTAQEPNQQWEQIKARERRDSSIMEGIPRALPALHKARRISEKAAGAGFDWPSDEGAWEKVHEELTELREAAAQGDARHTEHELGDVLFAIVNVARFLRVDPEAALQSTNARFVRRFRHVEEGLKAAGTPLPSKNLDAMNSLWEEAKEAERSP